MKVLLITYYWPPSGGVAVQRWLKMSKYLVNHDIQLTVFTPDLASFPGYDIELLKEIPKEVNVIKIPIIEPHNIFNRWMKSENNNYNPLITNDKGSAWKKNIGYFIRGNFFIPDARCLWIRPSVKFLTKHLSQNDFDIIITTGPPHSMHLIGLGLKKRFPKIKWIADFRDPWTEIYHFNDFLISLPAKKLHQYLEKKVLKNADEIVAVSPTCGSNLSILAQRNVQVVNNGYSEEDFKHTNLTKSENFVISYVGSINAERNPVGLWEALNHLTKTNSVFKQRLKIIFAGLIDNSIIESIKDFGLSAYFEYKGQISHQQAIHLMQNSNILLLNLFSSHSQNGVITGKFYEYLRSGIPILAFGNTSSDVSSYLKKFNAGKLFEYHDVTSIEEYIVEIFNNPNQMELYFDNSGIKEFERCELTKKYINIFNNLINKE